MRSWRRVPTSTDAFDGHLARSAARARFSATPAPTITCRSTSVRCDPGATRTTPWAIATIRMRRVVPGPRQPAAALAGFPDGLRHAAGNLTRKRLLSAADTTVVLRRDSLFWSVLGALDSVHTRDSLNVLTSTGFGYDALGRRIRKSTAAGTRRYVWDGNDLLAELDSLGNGLAGYSYYPGVDNPAAVLRHDRGDRTYYYFQDKAGNVTALLKAGGSGAVAANRYAYSEPFGSDATVTETVPNVLRYAGREYDAETELYYNRARYYDPAAGRFISEDPLGLSAGINPYAYGGNDPINQRDPSGLCGPKAKAPPVGSGPAAAPPSNKGCGGGSSSDIAAWAAAADAWFLANHGFGLRDALNGTSGDCLFSGGGSYACSVGSFSAPGAAAKWVHIRFASGWGGCPIMKRNNAMDGDPGRVDLLMTGGHAETWDAKIQFNVTQDPDEWFTHASTKDYFGIAVIWIDRTRQKAAFSGRITGHANCNDGTAVFEN